MNADKDEALDLAECMTAGLELDTPGNNEDNKGDIRFPEQAYSLSHSAH